MKAYPEYKESGSEIIKAIPAHWDFAPLKFIGNIILGKMLTPQDKGGYVEKPYLRAKNIGWETVDDDDINTMWFSQYELEQYRLKQNDLLISEGGEVGRTAIWNSELDECYIQNSVHKVTINQGHNPRYYLYHSQVFGKTGYYDSIVNRVSIGHLTGEKLKDIRFVVPSLPEQQAIADFLDRKTAQIDTLIEKKQQQIDLLQEQRTALINNAVTKGLNPDVRMKDSGVEWLGEIPSHWEVLPLKRVVLKFVDYRGHTPVKTDSGVLLITAKNIKDGRLDFEKSKEFIAEDGYDSWMVRGMPEKGDVMVTTEAPLGATAQIEDENVALAQRLILLKADKEQMDNTFLKYYFLSQAGQDELYSQGTGSTALGIKASKFYNINTIIPPLAEQQKIVEYILNEESRILSFVNKTEEIIEFLQEYRTALISEAVTGKIDVRTAETVHESPTGTA